MTAPVLLAIDCSTEVLCLAACAQDRQLLWHGPGGAGSSAVLVSQARQLLGDLGVDFSALDAVAFGQGPGAFTGLRTACSVAQGLALGTGCPVLPIDSLLIVAEAANHRLAAVSTQAATQEEASTVMGVAVDARMGDLYAACYVHRGRSWLALEAPLLGTAEVVKENWQHHAVAHCAGSGVGMLEEISAQVCPVDDEDRTASLLRLALASWHAGAGLPAGEAMPLYVRDKVAQTMAERRLPTPVPTAP